MSSFRIQNKGVYDLSATAVAVAGGRYQWSAAATWAGGSLALKYIGEDDTTEFDPVGGAMSLSANGAHANVIEIGEGTKVKHVVTGSPTGIVSRLRCLSPM